MSTCPRENLDLNAEKQIKSDEIENINQKTIKERKRPISSSIRKAINFNKDLKKKNEILNQNNEAEKIKIEKEKYSISSNNIKEKIKLNCFFEKRKNKKKVNFIEKYMITVIEIESFKKYNYLNTSRSFSSKDSIACNCHIF